MTRRAAVAGSGTDWVLTGAGWVKLVWRLLCTGSVGIAYRTCPNGPKLFAGLNPNWNRIELFTG